VRENSLNKLTQRLPQNSKFKVSGILEIFGD
jgi:hypothetical protein